MRIIFILSLLAMCVSCGGSSKQQQFPTSSVNKKVSTKVGAAANQAKNKEAEEKEKNEKSDDDNSKQTNFVTNEYCQLKFGTQNFEIYAKEGGLSEADPSKLSLTYWGVDKKHYKVAGIEFDILRLDEFNQDTTTRTIDGADGPQEISNKVTHYSAKIHIKSKVFDLLPADTAGNKSQKEFMYISMCASIEKQ